MPPPAPSYQHDSPRPANIRSQLTLRGVGGCQLPPPLPLQPQPRMCSWGAELWAALLPPTPPPGKQSSASPQLVLEVSLADISVGT